MPSGIALSVATYIIASCASIFVAEAAEPLVLESKIALGKVTGRIDHLAIDLPRLRLFVAELGNNSVGVLELKQRELQTKLQAAQQQAAQQHLALLGADALHAAGPVPIRQ